MDSDQLASQQKPADLDLQGIKMLSMVKVKMKKKSFINETLSLSQ